MKVAEFDIEVERKPIKNVHLSVYPPDGRVHVSAPDFMREDDISMFLYSKLSWIRKQRESVISQERQDAREFVTGESHYLFGNRYLLKVIPVTTGRTFVLQKTKYLEMYVRPNATLESKHNLLNEFYRSELTAKLDVQVKKWSEVLQENDRPITWQVLTMKKQWGSCLTEKRKIMFNLLLARVPIRCIEYIVLHELCHLKTHLHNKEFRALLNQHMPDWEIRKKELDDFIAAEWMN